MSVKYTVQFDVETDDDPADILDSTIDLVRLSPYDVDGDTVSVEELLEINFDIEEDDQ